jgi:hypothetical protein
MSHQPLDVVTSTDLDPAGDDVNMETTTHPSAPNVIRKGDNYWYTDRDGIIKRVEVVDIDHNSSLIRLIFHSS